MTEDSNVEILVTGSKFLEVPGVIGTSSVMEKIMSNVDNELQILAFDITTHATEFLNLLQVAIKRGKNTTMILNRPDESQSKYQPRMDAIRELENMSSKHPHFKFVMFPVEDKTLHAKVVIVDRKIAYVGSSNFTWGGMSKNYEVGILVGQEQSYTLSKLVDSLLPSKS